MRFIKFISTKHHQVKELGRKISSIQENSTQNKAESLLYNICVIDQMFIEETTCQSIQFGGCLQDKLIYGGPMVFYTGLTHLGSEAFK